LKKCSELLSSHRRRRSWSQLSEAELRRGILPAARVTAVIGHHSDQLFLWAVSLRYHCQYHQLSLVTSGEGCWDDPRTWCFNKYLEKAECEEMKQKWRNAVHPTLHIFRMLITFQPQNFLIFGAARRRVGSKPFLRFW
jgi:hypothetical protein